MQSTTRSFRGMRNILLLLGVALAIFVLFGFLVQRRGEDSVKRAKQLVALHARGIALTYQHDFAAAEDCFLELTREAPGDAQLWVSLGIAQLNQAEAGVSRALVSLERAKQLAPADARAAFCLGIIHSYLSNLDASLVEFERALKLAPTDPDAHYQYAKALRSMNKPVEALPHYEAALVANPNLGGAWYQLAQLYRQAGRIADAERAAARHKELEDTGRGDPRGLKFSEMGTLAEPVRDWPKRGPGYTQFVAANTLFASAIPLAGAAAPFAFVDQDLDGAPELWCGGAQPGAWNLAVAPVSRRELAPLAGARSFAVGDIDEDGRVDLLALSTTELRLFLLATGSSEPDFRTPVSGFEQVRLLDFDLEGDLDALLTGATASPRLAINNGRKLAPIENSPVMGAGAVGAVLLASDLDGDGDVEILLRAGAELALIDNEPQWRFPLVERQERLPRRDAADVRAAAAADLDGDGDDELMLLDHASLAIYMNSDFGRFTTSPQSVPIGAHGVLPLDADLDGRVDLLLPCDSASVLLLNREMPEFERVTLPAARGAAAADADGDYDLDLVLETLDGSLAFVRSLLSDRDRSDVPNPPRAVKLYFGGVRDREDRRTNLHGIGVRVEITAGSLRQSRVHDGGLGISATGGTSQGFAPMLVGIGARERAESLYLEWPDGVVQGEYESYADPATAVKQLDRQRAAKKELADLQSDPTRTADAERLTQELAQLQEALRREPGFAANKLHVIPEVQRKASSCPVLFTWDGERFRFITDFMGGGGLGFWIGTDTYGPPDPTETVLISGDALAPLNGEFVLSVMEPMQEIAYIDQLTLRVVDHPETYDVQVDEFFSTCALAPTGAPLFIDRRRIVRPTAARNAGGESVLSRLVATDRRYPNGIQVDPCLVGYAERHSLTLEFAEFSPSANEDMRLFLSGWVEYPYSRINFAASQSGRRLEPPTFWWRRDASEEWQLLHRELGYPAGMPKTMVVDLNAAVRGGARELRIDTNMEIYWDEIFAAPVERVAARAGGSREQVVELKSASLRWGGYPREFSDDGALPATYHYELRDAHLSYKSMQGGVTRYGETRALLQEVDDEFAIVGGGDELLLHFDSAGLPPLAAGWRRTFLLETHGYCKDIDTLTAAATTVEPLPFRSMTNYPPPATERGPDRTQYVNEWNTRND
ncbi:MAG: FG-GAP-like repeat-containing protein [Planctomycetota bacterium]